MMSRRIRRDLEFMKMIQDVADAVEQMDLEDVEILSELPDCDIEVIICDKIPAAVEVEITSRGMTLLFRDGEVKDVPIRRRRRSNIIQQIKNSVVLFV